MNDADYPALWRSSDLAAASSKRLFLSLISLHLLLLAFTGIVAIWTPSDVVWQRIAAWTIAIPMFAAFGLSLAIRVTRADDKWFEARAFAENAKQAAWQFMMAPGAGPAAAKDPLRDQYFEVLNAIKQRFPFAASRIAAFSNGGREITDRMLMIRASSLESRYRAYIDHRVQAQIEWYAKSARSNANLESRWFWIILALEATAVVAAFSRVASESNYNFTGALAVVAACFIAWSQTRRFSDLANTYNVAAIDLQLIKERYAVPQDHVELMELVNQAEAAISREHRLWIERRLG